MRAAEQIQLVSLRHLFYLVGHGRAACRLPTSAINGIRLVVRDKPITSAMFLAT
jgi:hypothetical protein